METTLSKSDHNLANIKIKVVEDDYKKEYSELLKKHAKKANMKGFRPGKVPVGLINKMYGPEIKSETLNEAIQGALFKYLDENNLNILFYPVLKSEALSGDQLKNDKDYEFEFAVQLKPNLEVPLDGQYEGVINYSLDLSEEDLEKELENTRRRMADFKESDTITGGAFVSGILEPTSLPKPETAPEVEAEPAEEENAEAVASVEAEETEEVEAVEAEEVDDFGDAIGEDDEDEYDNADGGDEYSYMQEDGRFRTMVPLNRLEESMLELFDGKEVGDTIIFDIRKAFPNAEDVKVLLQVPIEEAEKIEGEYRLVVEKISAEVLPELDKEFFVKVLGEEKAANTETMEDFKSEFKKLLLKNNKDITDFLTINSLKKQLIEQVEVDINEPFIRELLKNNYDRELSEKELENVFESQIELIRWDIITNQILKNAEVAITEQQLLTEAKKLLNAQFQSWGMAGISLPEDRMDALAQEYLNNSERNNKTMIESRVRDNTVLELFREKTDLESKVLALDEAEKLYEQVSKANQPKPLPEDEPVGTEADVEEETSSAEEKE